MLRKFKDFEVNLNNLRSIVLLLYYVILYFIINYIILYYVILYYINVYHILYFIYYILYT